MYIKCFICFAVLVILTIQQSNGNAIGDRELDNKINKMWEAVNKLKNNYVSQTELRLKKPHYTQEMKEQIWKKINKINKKLVEHFEKIEEKSRETGKLRPFNIEVKFFDLILEEIETLRSETKTKLKAKLSGDIEQIETLQNLLNIIDMFFDKLNDCLTNMKNEFVQNPNDIFEPIYFEKIISRMTRMQSILLNCKISTDNAMKEMSQTFKDIGLSDEEIKKFESAIVF